MTTLLQKKKYSVLTGNLINKILDSLSMNKSLKKVRFSDTVHIRLIPFERL